MAWDARLPIGLGYNRSMKLVLCSEGFKTDNTVQACVELCNKPQDQISVAVINEAYAAEEGDKYWVVDNLNSVAQNFTGGLDIVDLLALPLDTVKQRIMQCDVIFTIGGQVDYLMSVFNKTGFAKLLPELLETKVYVGSSAGSMVLGKRLSAEAYDTMYGQTGTYGITKYMELVDVAIMPHMDSEHFPHRQETLLQAAGDHPGTIYGLRDDSALVVNGLQRSLIGSPAIVIQDGQVVAS